MKRGQAKLSSSAAMPSGAHAAADMDLQVSWCATCRLVEWLVGGLVAGWLVGFAACTDMDLQVSWLCNPPAWTHHPAMACIKCMIHGDEELLRMHTDVDTVHYRGLCMVLGAWRMAHGAWCWMRV